MPKVDLLNMEGKKVGDIELSSEIFDVEVKDNFWNVLNQTIDLADL